MLGSKNIAAKYASIALALTVTTTAVTTTAVQATSAPNQSVPPAGPSVLDDHHGHYFIINDKGLIVQTDQKGAPLPICNSNIHVKNCVEPPANNHAHHGGMAAYGPVTYQPPIYNPPVYQAPVYQAPTTTPVDTRPVTEIDKGMDELDMVMDGATTMVGKYANKLLADCEKLAKIEEMKGTGGSVWFGKQELATYCRDPKVAAVIAMDEHSGFVERKVAVDPGIVQERFRGKGLDVGAQVVVGLGLQVAQGKYFWQAGDAAIDQGKAALGIAAAANAGEFKPETTVTQGAVTVSQSTGAVTQSQIGASATATGGVASAQGGAGGAGGAASLNASGAVLNSTISGCASVNTGAYASLYGGASATTGAVQTGTGNNGGVNGTTSQGSNFGTLDTNAGMGSFASYPLSLTGGTETGSAAANIACAPNSTSSGPYGLSQPAVTNGSGTTVITPGSGSAPVVNPATHSALDFKSMQRLEQNFSINKPESYELAANAQHPTKSKGYNVTRVTVHYNFG